LQPGGPVTEKLVDAISLEGPAVTLRSPLVRFSCENGFLYTCHAARRSSFKPPEQIRVG
jgi:hypothetical protein